MPAQRVVVDAVADDRPRVAERVEVVAVDPHGVRGDRQLLDGQREPDLAGERRFEPLAQAAAVELLLADRSRHGRCRARRRGSPAVVADVEAEGRVIGAEGVRPRMSSMPAVDSGPRKAPTDSGASPQA